jgi:hypothetical protein
VKPPDRTEGARLEAAMRSFAKDDRPLPGIESATRRQAFIEQVLESMRRIKFIAVLRTRDVSDRRADPRDLLFDPLKAAILQQRRGNVEEAFWLLFLYIHFGKHSKAGWRYARDVYGRLGEGGRWDWQMVSNDVAGFRAWLNAHQGDLMKGKPRGFGNHRKRESLAGLGDKGTGAAVETYVAWINPPRTHQELMSESLRAAEGDPGMAFDLLYRAMEVVRRFGRLARFDYLTMVGKLELAPIKPRSAYLNGSTGPLAGAKLLFGNGSAANLDDWVVQLDGKLRVGMQVLEDSLCNWQKSPEKFKAFRG